MKWIVLWTLILFSSEESKDFGRDAYGNVKSRMGSVTSVQVEMVKTEEKFRVFTDSTTALDFYNGMPENAKNVFIYKLEDWE